MATVAVATELDEVMASPSFLGCCSSVDGVPEKQEWDGEAHLPLHSLACTPPPRRAGKKRRRHSRRWRGEEEMVMEKEEGSKPPHHPRCRCRIEPAGALLYVNEWPCGVAGLGRSAHTELPMVRAPATKTTRRTSHPGAIAVHRVSA